MENKDYSSITADEELLRQGILEHAIYLGMDPVVDSRYLWIAEQSLLAPLPPYWTQCVHEGKVYFFNTQTNQSSWQHPSDEEYRQYFVATKQRELSSQPIDNLQQPFAIQRNNNNENHPFESGSFEDNSTTSSSNYKTEGVHVDKCWEDVLNEMENFLLKCINEASNEEDRLTESDYKFEDIKKMVIDVNRCLEQITSKIPELSKASELHEGNEDIKNNPKHTEKERDDPMGKNTEDLNEEPTSKEIKSDEPSSNMPLQVVGSDHQNESDCLTKARSQCLGLSLPEKERYLMELEKYYMEMNDCLRNIENLKSLTLKYEEKDQRKCHELERTYMLLEDYEQEKYSLHTLILKLNIDLGEAKTIKDSLFRDLKNKEHEASTNYQQLQCWKEKFLEERKRLKVVRDNLLKLQGNIRVFCRIRPMLNEENKIDDTDKENTSHIKYLDEESFIFSANRFEFDHIFRPHQCQEEVFQEIADSIGTVMEGHTVTVVAYGQTSSGKTFTMEGTEKEIGIYFRSFSMMFDAAMKLDSDIQYTFSLSIIEIYNETVIDLFGLSERDVYMDNEKVKVKNLVERTITSIDDTKQIIMEAMKNRKKANNNINAESSRSHLLMQVNIIGKKSSGEVYHGKLHLIDLAGSERLKNTHASGERLKEAQNINRSLSAFGDVLAALGSKKSHVPYRNSTLTFLMKNSLCAGAKVIMFVNINPSFLNQGESLCSLNFAKRCKAIKFGRAKKNIK